MTTAVAAVKEPDVGVRLMVDCQFVPITAPVTQKKPGGLEPPPLRSVQDAAGPILNALPPSTPGTKTNPSPSTAMSIGLDSGLVPPTAASMISVIDPLGVTLNTMSLLSPAA